MTTTPYAVSKYMGSARTNGFNPREPFNTSQTPHIMPPNHAPVTTPFYPGQEPIYSDMNSLLRTKFVRGSTPLNDKKSKLYPMSGDMHINQLKTNTVGKPPLTLSKNVDSNVTRSALRRMRSGGTCAPAKKGSIYR